MYLAVVTYVDTSFAFYKIKCLVELIKLDGCFWRKKIEFVIVLLEVVFVRCYAKYFLILFANNNCVTNKLPWQLAFFKIFDTSRYTFFLLSL